MAGSPRGGRSTGHGRNLEHGFYNRNCADGHFTQPGKGFAPHAHVLGIEILLPLPEHCLFKLGIHAGERWWFCADAPWLAANGPHVFCWLVPPFNLPGAVGSPATPVGAVWF